MNKQWWMPMKDIKTINPAVVLTQTKNNTSCFGGNDYISIATVIGERKMEWWCENYWVLMGWPVFHFTVTVKKKKDVFGKCKKKFYFSPDARGTQKYV